MRRLLLLSNSRNPGQGYLEHARVEIGELFGPIRELVFVPYAMVEVSLEDYTARVGEVLGPMGIAVRSLAGSSDPARLVGEAQAVAVGGGNSFQLLKRCYETGVLEALKHRALAGVPYLGWSAGANLACPTIRTTNDMPVAQPPSFEALGLVPFQINPHYTQAVLPNHGGETRDERIAEFLTLNPEVRVVGLREGSWLRVEGAALTLGGPHPLRLFHHGDEARECGPGEDLSGLLG
jgi:dipeptidase E